MKGNKEELEYKLRSSWYSYKRSNLDDDNKFVMPQNQAYGKEIYEQGFKDAWEIQQKEINRLRQECLQKFLKKSKRSLMTKILSNLPRINQRQKIMPKTIKTYWPPYLPKRLIIMAL